MGRASCFHQGICVDGLSGCWHDITMWFTVNKTAGEEKVYLLLLIVVHATFDCGSAEDKHSLLG